MEFHPQQSKTQHVGVEVGVGGTNLQAIDRPPESAARVLSCLMEWQEKSLPPAVFPFGAVLRHFQSHGRNKADTELVAALRALSEAGFPDKEEAISGMLLSTWLPSTFDQNNGDYDSYAVIPLLNRLADLHPVDRTETAERTEVALDEILVALLANMLLCEAAALARCGESHRQQLRTKACIRSVVKAAELAPRAGAVLTVAPADKGHTGAGSLADRADDLAHRVLDTVEPTVRLAVEITMLPTTTLHDEFMFIRSIQIFELVYRQVARCLERAVAAVGSGDLARATTETKNAAARIAATGTLYRVLTTMPQDAFAVIRASTQGRSAIQSRAYRDVERLAAPSPRTPRRTAADRWSLEGAYLKAFGSVQRNRLTDAMTELDGAWGSMKRTHWGITLKIIGRVSGTGGTSGADYLKESAARPLFPMLQEANCHA